jgi:hypothetical protein
MRGIRQGVPCLYEKTTFQLKFGLIFRMKRPNVETRHALSHVTHVMYVSCLRLTNAKQMHKTNTFQLFEMSPGSTDQTTSSFFLKKNI